MVTMQNLGDWLFCQLPETLRSKNLEVIILDFDEWLEKFFFKVGRSDKGFFHVHDQRVMKLCVTGEARLDQNWKFKTKAWRWVFSAVEMCSAPWTPWN